jgi:hypothetical protein
MSKKQKIDLTRPQDCVTLTDKIDFSLAVRQHEEDTAFSLLTDVFSAPWYDYEKYPWAHGEWATEYAKSAREQQRAQWKYLRGLK